ncbi:hypothetical protein KSP40_PGU021449 [Platanthera guangdongensis]|uniref:Uncharacterized protein n=1 Tax=Platanthera guangdongensis TaxID=2320717 RepID=A0ABR2MTZ9_9ASPA
MEESGDFVILDVNNQIMWLTFDTVVAGKILRSGSRLVSSVPPHHSSGRFQMVMQRDRILAMYPVNTHEASSNVYWDSGSNGEGYTGALFSDDGEFSLFIDANATHNSTLVTPFVHIGRMEPDGDFRAFNISGGSLHPENDPVESQDKCSILPADLTATAI